MKELKVTATCIYTDWINARVRLDGDARGVGWTLRQLLVIAKPMAYATLGWALMACRFAFITFDVAFSNAQCLSYSYCSLGHANGNLPTCLAFSFGSESKRPLSFLRVCPAVCILNTLVHPFSHARAPLFHSPFWRRWSTAGALSPSAPYGGLRLNIIPKS